MLVKLKDICTIKSSKRIFEKEYVESGIPFIRGKEITDKSISNPDNKFECYISKERFLELKESFGVPQVGDILMTAVGTVGNTYYINKQIDFYYKDGNVIQFTNFSKKINSEYLYFFFNSSLFNFILNNILIGAVQKALTMDMLKEIEIELPSLEIQNKIVNILSNIDNQIERNNAMTKRLQVLGNTIYSKIMTSFKTPKLLGDLVEMYQPETITSDKFVVNGDYPVYGAGGIIGFYNKYNHEEPQLMVSCRGICGKAELSLPKSFIIGNQMVIKPKNKKIKYFLYNYLLNCDLSCIETGSVQKQITRTNLEKLQILLPNEDVISEYYNIFENVYTQKTKIILETERLINLKEKLLPLLINGQLNI